MDLSLRFSPSRSYFDLSLDVLKDDLLASDSLETAVVLSLLCDRTAGESDMTAGDDRRGWWADAFAQNQNDKFGSRLWLLAREKRMPETVLRARSYIIEALQWLIDDGLATGVDATVFTAGTDWLVAQVQINLKTGSRQYRFEWSDATQAWMLQGEVN
jgi:phage gp46-like protein